MTRTHAAYQLLRHGPLDLGEFQAITGWTPHTCWTALQKLREAGAVRLIRRGGTSICRSVYEVVS